MSEREEAMRAELVGAERALRDAESRAAETAPWCADCGYVSTARIAAAKAVMLDRARLLAAGWIGDD